MVLKRSQKQSPNKGLTLNADQLEIVFYTDPLCCWSWAFEPQWRKLRYEFEGEFLWRYCMGGLIPSWKNFNDTANFVSRPIQMGPVWMEASHNSGMKIESSIWAEDPPASSYPACIAVKCASGQSFEAGEKYLRMLREAVMLHKKNIARVEVLTEIAGELSQLIHGFDVQKFKDYLSNDNGLEAFRKDLQEVQNLNISRFPSLIIRKPNQPSLILTGYRPYPVLLEAMKQIAPGLKKVRECTDAEAYRKFWSSVTEREISEAMM
jgi:predicted DsbA family dithiol-disulfide isomerase